MDLCGPGELGDSLFEYLLQVPANRIGHQVMNVGQLKILQEVVTLSVFYPFFSVFCERKTFTRLSVGRDLSAGRGFFSVPFQDHGGVIVYCEN
jgi:hypothetical protein